MKNPELRYGRKKRIPEWKVLLVALSTVVFVYAVDAISHESLRFYVFYFPALMIVSWYLDLKKTILLLGLSLSLWFLEYTREVSTHLWQSLVWNTGVTLVTFLAIVVMTHLLKQKQEMMMRLARTDPLTGAWNRAVLEEKLTEERLRSKRYDHSLSLIYFDLNHFKKINDTWGHAAGDKVLKETARVARQVIRETDWFIRMGGDEFCVLLPETDRFGAENCALKLQSSLEKQLPYKTTASFGVAVFQTMPQGISEILELADQTMYRAKSSGEGFMTAVLEDVLQKKEVG